MKCNLGRYININASGDFEQNGKSIFDVKLRFDFAIKIFVKMLLKSLTHRPLKPQEIYMFTSAL